MAPKTSVGTTLRVVASVLRPLLRALTKQEWTGRENVPPEGVGVVLTPNHLSWVDPLTVSHFVWDNGRIPRFLGKESLFRIPVIGRLITACGQIPVYRDSREAASALQAAVEGVEQGQCVIIYPEGTLTKDPELWPMAGKTGAARVALQTGCPVVPIAQWGPQQILGPRSKKLRLFPRKTIQVRAGEPVDLSDLRTQPLSPAVLREASERILTAMTRELATLRDEPPPLSRFDRRNLER